MQADGSSRSACTAAPFSWPDSSSPKLAWLLPLHPFNGMSRSSVLNLRRRLPKSHPLHHHLLRQLSDRLNGTLRQQLCVPHLLRQRSRPCRPLHQTLRQQSNVTQSNQSSPLLSRLPHNCLNALLRSPVLPNLRQRRMTVNLPCTRHRHRSRPPLTPAHCPRWQILRLQTHLSPRKCQKRHRNRPLSPPPLQPKRHRSPHRPTRLRLPENRTMAGSQGLCSSGLKHSNNIPPRRGCIAWKVG